MISIIVPVYNSEKYLTKCIRSIFLQTYKDFEIIIIDDGSTDNSSEICDMLALEDERVTVIHTMNNGVSSARNIGIDRANGKYIMFIDSDDWIEPNFLLSFINIANDSTDLIIGGYTEKNVNCMNIHSFKNIKFNKEDMKKYFEDMYSLSLTNSPFSKLYKKNVLAENRFNENIKLGEDFIFNIEYFKNCITYETIEESGYIYNCTNDNSATKKFRKNDIKQIIELFNIAKNFYINYCCENPQKNVFEERLCLNGINVLQLLFYSNEKNKYKLAMELLENNDFNNACKLKYSLPLKYDIPRVLCKNKNYIFLKLYFKCKKLVSIIKR